MYKHRVTNTPSVLYRKNSIHIAHSYQAVAKLCELHVHAVLHVSLELPKQVLVN